MKWSELAGWTADDHLAAFAAYQTSTGSAIVGPAHADLYWGAGEEAGRIAGRIRHPGRFVMLLPRELDIAAAGREAPLPLPKPKFAELEVGKEGGKGKAELGDTSGKGKVGLAGFQRRSRRRQDHFIAAAQTEDRGARRQDPGQLGQGCARDPEAGRQGQGQFCQCRREHSRPADAIAFAKHEDRRIG